MTHPLTTTTVYVEGDDDLRILRAWFPNIQFTSVSGKDKVASRTEQHPACFGLRDRDFAGDAKVTAGRTPDSRLVLLRRFCIENYLLEPDIIADAVRAMPAIASHLATWTDETFVRKQLTAWGAELALYACFRHRTDVSIQQLVVIGKSHTTCRNSPVFAQTFYATACGKCLMTYYPLGCRKQAMRPRILSSPSGGKPWRPTFSAISAHCRPCRAIRLSRNCSAVWDR